MLTAEYVGEKADACSISTGNVHKDAPQSKQQVCLVHCGEPKCGAALTFVDHHQKEIREHCAERSIHRVVCCCCCSRARVCVGPVQRRRNKRELISSFTLFSSFLFLSKVICFCCDPH